MLTLSLFLSCLVGGSQSYFYDRESLDDFLRKQANKETERLRKGVLSNVSLPSNFTGMEVSVVRLRSFSLWSRGMNYSIFSLPPRILPQPNEKRITILFENLGCICMTEMEPERRNGVWCVLICHMEMPPYSRIDF